jgi:hypothetical protein
MKLMVSATRTNNRRNLFFQSFLEFRITLRHHASLTPPIESYTPAKCPDPASMFPRLKNLASKYQIKTVLPKTPYSNASIGLKTR